MFFATWVSTLLLASAAFASPEGRVRRARRLAGHQTKSLQRVQTADVSDTPDPASSNISHTDYSSNWAGVILAGYPAGTFYEVTGTFTVPTPKAPDGSASAWVGIDGDTCGSAILQTGVDFNLENGVVSYDAWYEWYPNYAYDFEGITIDSGDVIKLTVTASSTTSGTAVVENLTTGQTVSQGLSSPDYPLCEQDAEWIVEDFSSGDGLVPFTDFGTVIFTNPYAYTHDDGILTPCNGTVIDVEQNNEVLTSVSVTCTPPTITIKYD